MQTETVEKLHPLPTREDFADLYRKHYRRVFQICIRMLRNAEEAEDLTQESFIQLYNNIHKYSGKAAFTTWLHRLTVNQVLMHMRKLRKRDWRTDSLPEDVPPAEQAEQFTIHTPSLVDRINLERAMDQLAPGYKRVVILHDLLGYEHQQIAKLLNMSEGCSKSQLHKGRLKLQRLLKTKANPRLYCAEAI